MQDELDSAGVQNEGMEAAEENVVVKALRLLSVGKAYKQRESADFSRPGASPRGTKLQQ